MNSATHRSLSIAREDKVANSKAKREKLSKLANKIATIECRDSTFVGLIKTVLNFAIASKEYNKKSVAIHIVDIV